MDKPRGLGKGLGALLPQINEEAEGKPQEIDVEQIVSNPYQPRKEFDAEKLEELKNSIIEHGVLQPLLVRQQGLRYELIAGERRLRAAKMAGLSKVPAMIKDLSNQEMMEVALIENLQREDLNPLEAAGAYQRLIDDFHLTQEEIAKRVGKSRSAVTNFLRLLNLPQQVKNLVLQSGLSMGHARAVLAIPTAEQQVEASNLIVQKNLSVRQAEELARKYADANVSRETKVKKEKPADLLLPIEWQEIEESLRNKFGTKVALRAKNAKEKSGFIEIEFYSEEDLQRIVELVL
ncbi:MAG: ParB/RepB/Spo0J family partition protein [Bacillota bacterium]